MREQIGVGLPRLVEVGAINPQRLVEQPTSPDLFRGLPHGFDLPRDKGGRIQWAKLNEDPEKFKRIVESCVLAILETGVSFRIEAFRESGNVALVGGIGQYYPGGFSSLKERLGFLDRKPPGFYNVENILREANDFYSDHGTLTAVQLNMKKKSGLAAAIRKRYPGGMRQLKDDLKIGNRAVPKGFWTPDVVEQEVLRFVQKEGDLSFRLLGEKKRADLIGAVRQYPGGINQLRLNIGLTVDRKPRTNWSEELIEKEAYQFYLDYGEITLMLLRANKRNDLRHALRKYEGGIRRLKLNLNIPNLGHRGNAYWDYETIEEEALRFFLEYRGLSYPLLIKNGRNDLSHALVKFPGGIRALREKLGIVGNTDPESLISLDQANEQLAKLLEVRM